MARYQRPRRAPGAAAMAESRPYASDADREILAAKSPRLTSLAEIQRLAEKGFCIQEISERTGLQWIQVKQRLNILGIEAKRGSPPPFSPEERKTVISMLLMKRSYTEIGAVIGRSRNAIAGFVKRMKDRKCVESR